jgi:hypothetical protein
VRGATLRVRITKRPDGGGVVHCTRADGSVTWQKQDRHAGFFALHDLTHFAVETTLGFRQGFFGLVAAGWDLEDTTGKGKRGHLPDEALEVEQWVGMLDRERGGGTLWTAEEFNDVMRTASAGKAVRQVSADDLIRLRARRSDLFQQWAAVTAGCSLELIFETGSRTGVGALS